MNRLELPRRPENVVHRSSHMVSIVSGKGGAGKSMVAFNVAERLSASGASVLLVDGDLECGNQHILANMSCAFGVTEFVADEMPLSDAVTKINDLWHLLPAPASDGQSNCDLSKLADKLRFYGNNYDIIIIDLPSGITSDTLATAVSSELCLLLLLPELTSISDCFGLYKRICKQDRTTRCALLVNRAESDTEAIEIHDGFAELCRQFLRQFPESAGSLPEDSLFRKALASQQPLASLEPEAGAVQCLTKLARYIFNSGYSGKSETGKIHIKSTKEEPATADIRE